MKRLGMLLPVLLLATASCAPPEAHLHLPEGNELAGREAFQAMRCYVCHEVPGETFPAPHASPPVPIALGSRLALLTRSELAESVLAPSHVVPRGIARVSHGELSRMGDYSDAMTVRQWLDIVRYLESLASRYEVPRVEEVLLW